MNKLPQIRSKDILKILKKAGFYVKRKSGSHFYLKHPDGRFTSISVHSGTIPKGTLRAIIRQIDLTPEEFKELINKTK